MISNREKPRCVFIRIAKATDTPLAQRPCHGDPAESIRTAPLGVSPWSVLEHGITVWYSPHGTCCTRTDALIVDFCGRGCGQNGLIFEFVRQFFKRRSGPSWLTGCSTGPDATHEYRI